MEPTSVPLAKIALGGSIDSRVTARNDGVEGLAASITALGLLQPLLVRKTGKTDFEFEVIAGNRRLQALRLMAETGRATGETLVSVIVRESEDLDAFEASLAENVMRLPPHPIDQYEAFARIAAERNFDASEIAARFGTSTRQVEQMLALGDLHPDIRKAWRKADIRDDTAMAFTLARGNPAKQLEVFKKLRKQSQLFAHAVKTALGTGDAALNTALLAVGETAYRAAGGDVVVDLFGNEPIVSDPTLLRSMLDAMVQSKCNSLIGDGWSWAIARSTVSDYWNWRQASGKRPKPSEAEAAELAKIEARQKEIAATEDEDGNIADELSDEHDALEERRVAIEAELDGRKYSDKAKKKVGCMVSVERTGAISVAYGFERPQDTKAAEKAAKDKEREKEKAAKAARGEPVEPEAPKISDALVHDLSTQFSKAVSLTIAQDDTKIALASAYAALAVYAGSSPIKITLGGIPMLHDRAPSEFCDLFLDAMEWPVEDLKRQLAKRVSQSVEIRKHRARQFDDSESALLGVIDTTLFAQAAAETFDASDYFRRAPLACAQAALAEMGKPAARGKKADIVAAAIEAQAASKWVPAEMRLPAQAARRAEAAE